MTIDELITHLEELKKTHHLENVEIITPVKEKHARGPFGLTEFEHTGEMTIVLSLHKYIMDDLRRNS
jgi:hypothetical protein